MREVLASESMRAALACLRCHVSSVILRPTFCVGRRIYATGAKADCDLLLRSKSHGDQLGYARFLHRHTI